jgi:hypothetical protein
MTEWPVTFGEVLTQAIRAQIVCKMDDIYTDHPTSKYPIKWLHTEPSPSFYIYLQLWLD